MEALGLFGVDLICGRAGGKRLRLSGLYREIHRTDHLKVVPRNQLGFYHERLVRKQTLARSNENLAVDVFHRCWGFCIHAVSKGRFRNRPLLSLVKFRFWTQPIARVVAFRSRDCLLSWAVASSGRLCRKRFTSHRCYCNASETRFQQRPMRSLYKRCNRGLSACNKLPLGTEQLFASRNADFGSSQSSVRKLSLAAR